MSDNLILIRSIGCWIKGILLCKLIMYELQEQLAGSEHCAVCILLFAVFCKYYMFFLLVFIFAYIKIYFCFYWQNGFVSALYSPFMLDKRTFTLSLKLQSGRPTRHTLHTFLLTFSAGDPLSPGSVKHHISCRLCLDMIW
jgi:hypothetical protein